MAGGTAAWSGRALGPSPHWPAAPRRRLAPLGRRACSPSTSPWAWASASWPCGTRPTPARRPTSCSPSWTPPPRPRRRSCGAPSAARTGATAGVARTTPPHRVDAAAARVAAAADARRTTPAVAAAVAAYQRAADAVASALAAGRTDAARVRRDGRAGARRRRRCTPPWPTPPRRHRASNDTAGLVADVETLFMMVFAAVMAGLLFRRFEAARRSGELGVAAAKAQGEARFQALVHHSSDLITLIDADLAITLPDALDHPAARLRRGRADRHAAGRPDPPRGPAVAARRPRRGRRRRPRPSTTSPSCGCGTGTAATGTCRASTPTCSPTPTSGPSSSPPATSPRRRSWRRSSSTTPSTTP